jgi:hypothetical protein
VKHSHRINNKRDPVGGKLGYTHTRGGVYTRLSRCASYDPKQNISLTLTRIGIDITDVECQIGSVTSIFVANVLDHFGPYEGILLGTFFCD